MDIAKEPFSKNQIKTFLQNKGIIQSQNSELTITQYTNGYSNLTYLLQIEEQEFVLRRPPEGAVKRGHDMSREYKVLSNLQKEFDYAPTAILYCEDREVIGSKFYLMEKVEGIILTMEEAMNRKIPAEAFKTISNSWLEKLVELHKVDYRAADLLDLGKPDSYVVRQVENWGKQYLKAATMDIPEAEKLMQWMQANQPGSYDKTLIHNDYKYDNVVFKNEEWKEISAILDWEMCTLGDPLMDLGTSVAYWMTSADGPAAKVLPSPTIMSGNPSRTEIVQHYARLSGRDVDNFVFYYAFGLFKIAVIAQQIFFRYNKGLAKDEKFAKLDKACKLFMKMGWQAVQTNRIENFM